MVLIISGIIYFLGYALAFIMQRTEIAAEQETYTFGTRLLILSLSLLSFVFVFIMLIRSWVKMISLTGYWDNPIKPVEERLSDIKSPKKTQLN